MKCNEVSTSGGAWNSEGIARSSSSTGGYCPESCNRLSVHRDSLDLQSTYSNSSRKSKNRLYKEAKSKLIGILGREQHQHSQSAEYSDDEIDLRWSGLSEARETALLNREPKSISKRHGRLPFRTFAKGEAVLKAVTGIGHSQNRSYTPPKNRNQETAKMPGSIECSANGHNQDPYRKITRSNSKDSKGSRGGRRSAEKSPRCRSPFTDVSQEGLKNATFPVGVLNTCENAPEPVDVYARAADVVRGRHSTR